MDEFASTSTIRRIVGYIFKVYSHVRVSTAGIKKVEAPQMRGSLGFLFAIIIAILLRINLKNTKTFPHKYWVYPIYYFMLNMF